MVLLMCCENFKSANFSVALRNCRPAGQTWWVLAGYRLCFGVRCCEEQVHRFFINLTLFCVNDRFIGFCFVLFFAFETVLTPLLREPFTFEARR